MSPAPASGSTSSDTKGTERVINSDAVVMEATREGGGKAWILRAESSRVGLDEDGKTRVFLNEVSGEVLDGSEVGSRFTAKEAKADSVARSLVLSGAVRLVSVAKKTTLQADKVLWIEERKVFAASGSVRIESPDWTLGPMGEVWALPDLSKVGSPEKFKK